MITSHFKTVSRELLLKTFCNGNKLVSLQYSLCSLQVIGVCGGSEKTALVLERGAHFVVDFKCENVRDRLKDITKGKGVNVAIDHVGGNLFMQCLKR